MKTILLVDDHSIIRDAIKLILRDEVDFSIVGEADNGQAAIDFLNLYPHVDLIIMDVSMPVMGGIEATRKIIENNENANILMFSMKDSEDVISDSLLAGAKGYLTKNSPKENLVQAIRLVSQGRYYLAPEVAEVLVLMTRFGSKRQASINELLYGGTPEELFTNKELEVLDLICRGYSTTEIADVLECAKRTVENHRSSMMTKVKVNSVVSLVMYAVDSGFVDRRRKKGKSPKGIPDGEDLLK